MAIPRSNNCCCVSPKACLSASTAASSPWLAPLVSLYVNVQCMMPIREQIPPGKYIIQTHDLYRKLQLQQSTQVFTPPSDYNYRLGLAENGTIAVVTLWPVVPLCGDHWFNIEATIVGADGSVATGSLQPLVEPSAGGEAPTEGYIATPPDKADFGWYVIKQYDGSYLVYAAPGSQPVWVPEGHRLYMLWDWIETNAVKWAVYPADEVAPTNAFWSFVEAGVTPPDPVGS